MKRILTFILLLTLSTGSLFAQFAKFSIVHNSPSADLAHIDIYVNGVRTANETNLGYQYVTGFDSVASGVPVQLAIAPGNSSGIADTVASITLDSLQSGHKYYIVFSGFTNPGAYHSNPDGLSTGLSVRILDGAQLGGAGSGTASFVVFHGVTDAPYIDVKVRGVGTVINNLAYGQFSPAYITVPAKDYIIDIYDSTGTTLLKTLYANLSTAAAIPGGASAFVFASGFADTTGQGSEFNLYAGIVGFPTSPGIPFEIVKTTHLQMVHNAADPALDTVDLYMITSPDTAVIGTYHNVAFRTASPVIDIPSQIPMKLVVAPKGSSGITNALATIPLGQMLTDSNYVAFVNGVANSANFTANPDGLSIDLNAYVKKSLVPTGVSGNTDILVFHGATDAPTVDVRVQHSATPLVNNIYYGRYAGYANVPADVYHLDVTDSSESNVIGSYYADLSGLADKRIVIFASGFVSPAAGQPSFGLWAALADGTTYPLTDITGIKETEAASNVNLYPNPTVSNVRMTFSIEKNSPVQYRLVNALGQVVKSADLGTLNSGNNQVDLNVSNLPSGMYMLNLVIGNNSSTTRSFIVE